MTNKDKFSWSSRWTLVWLELKIWLKCKKLNSIQFNSLTILTSLDLYNFFFYSFRVQIQFGYVKWIELFEFDFFTAWFWPLFNLGLIQIQFGFVRIYLGDSKLQPTQRGTSKFEFIFVCPFYNVIYKSHKVRPPTLSTKNIFIALFLNTQASLQERNEEILCKDNSNFAVQEFR